MRTAEILKWIAADPNHRKIVIAIGVDGMVDETMNAVLYSKGLPYACRANDLPSLMAKVHAFIRKVK